MEKTPEAIVVLAGHTDNTGTEKYNDGLSLRRAKAVESYLTGERGIPPNRLIIKGYGESAPIGAKRYGGRPGEESPRRDTGCRNSG